ncbi:hypothetical protein QKT49_gp423 [Acanthamoeba castellanii medusavirus]|uniref:Uncharacterized protein n=1 Tax=Acanthamoeba castellanii medusavirus J1 TaxID=3114988 RepID=A0A3T1CWX8_9VIRU|nr:hypothetical protein QKT49_gp423 [Acanthamoeba castellanii medusavirus]BBI30340.1 hypothetical protein [Acanthamoeba castellanii medusavirus J1]
MSSAATPPADISANTLVEVSLTDGNLNVPAGIVWRVPSLRPAIIESAGSKSEEAISVPADMPAFLVAKKRPAIRIAAQMTKGQWTELIDHVAYDGKMTESAASLCLRNGIALDSRVLDFLALPTGAIVEKDSCVQGALMALITANNRFGSIRRSLTEHGATSTIISTNSRAELRLSKNANAYKFHWPITRSSDGFSWPCIKVLLPALPAGLKWRPDVVERLMCSARMHSGGTPVFSTTGTANKMLAQTFNVWPDLTNSYGSTNAYMRSSKPWLVAIPIVSNETISDRKMPFFPMVCMPYHDVDLQVTMEMHMASLIEGPIDAHPADTIAPLQIALELDGVFLNADERRQLAKTSTYQPFVAKDDVTHAEENVPKVREEGPQSMPCVDWMAASGENAELVKRPSPAPESTSGYRIIFDPVEFKENVPANGIVKLGLTGGATGFIFRLSPINTSDKMVVSACPLTSATLKLNGSRAHVYDIVDLVELNWKKSGRAKPHDEGVMLFPFGHRAVEQDSGDFIDFSHIEKAEIALAFQPQFSPADWKLDLVTLGQNVGMNCGGMYGVKFAH